MGDNLEFQAKGSVKFEWCNGRNGSGCTRQPGAEQPTVADDQHLPFGQWPPVIFRQRKAGDPGDHLILGND